MPALAALAGAVLTREPELGALIVAPAFKVVAPQFIMLAEIDTICSFSRSPVRPVDRTMA
jgi:hypothetical protein